MYCFYPEQDMKQAEGLALQTLTTEEVTVWRTRICRKFTGVIQSTQVQENRPLMIAHKIRFPCGEEKEWDYILALLTQPCY